MNMRISARPKNGMTSSIVMTLVMTCILFACRPAPVTFRPLTESEVEAFSIEQGVTFLNQISFEDSTLLLYEKGPSFGYYALSVSEPDGELIVNQLSATKSSDPILVVGQYSGTYPFVAVVIQDPTLSAETTTIEVTDSSGPPLKTLTHGQESAILVSSSFANGWETITLYNAQGEVLYRQEI